MTTLEEISVLVLELFALNLFSSSVLDEIQKDGSELRDGDELVKFLVGEFVQDRV